MPKTSCSIWRKDGKQLRLFSNENNGEKVKRFYFVGHNPFPCYSMNSTFHVVADWLKANGWERQPGGFETITRESEHTNNGCKVIVRETVGQRFVPFNPAQ